MYTTSGNFFLANPSVTWLRLEVSMRERLQTHWTVSFPISEEERKPFSTKPQEDRKQLPYSHQVSISLRQRISNESDKVQEYRYVHIPFPSTYIHSYVHECVHIYTANEQAELHAATKRIVSDKALEPATKRKAPTCKKCGKPRKGHPRAACQ